MIDLDFESWLPLWYDMTHNSIMKDYVNASIALVQKRYPSWTNMTQIEAEAEAMERASRGGGKSQTLTTHNQPTMPKTF